MGPDRGMGGSMEQPHSSTGNEGESRQEQDVSRPSNTTDEQQPQNTGQRQLPRQIGIPPPSRTSSPAIAPPLSREASSMSTATAAQSTEDIRADTIKNPEPPVTKATLSELDVMKIVHNPKLRHDINFDPDLHFRPNMDGEKGKKKQDKANVFWDTLRNDLTMFLTDREKFDKEYASSGDWTLPRLLTSAKEIIQTLVPSRDRAVLDEGLNVELFMQQFYRGVADLEKLASWLRGVLKLHCAPMRDDWVDTVYYQLSNGNANNDLKELVNGMKNLLTVLEAMKLDVANHQIRCLRPALIEDTVHFEQKYFYRRIAAGRMRMDNLRVWYQNALERYQDDTLRPSQDFGDMGVFFETLARHLMPQGASDPIPATFQFDDERIARLTNDMYDAVFIEGCLRQYERLEGVCHIFGASQEGSSRPSSQDGESTLDSPFGAFRATAGSRPSSQAFSTRSSHSSPRSSLVIPSPSAIPSYLQPQPSQTDLRTKRQKLHRTLIDILQSAPANTHQMDRWRAVGPAMALEVFRATNLPLRLLPEVEDAIVNRLLQASGEDFRDLQQQMLERLMEALRDRVRRYRGLSGSALFATATGELHADLYEAAGDSGVEDIATKLAHVGIVHWRVWAEPVYLDTPMSR